MCERVQLLEKASRQFELDNERLAFKVKFFEVLVTAKEMIDTNNLQSMQ